MNKAVILEKLEKGDYLDLVQFLIDEVERQESLVFVASENARRLEERLNRVDMIVHNAKLFGTPDAVVVQEISEVLGK